MIYTRLLSMDNAGSSPLTFVVPVRSRLECIMTGVNVLSGAAVIVDGDCFSCNLSASSKGSGVGAAPVVIDEIYAIAEMSDWGTPIQGLSICGKVFEAGSQLLVTRATTSAHGAWIAYFLCVFDSL